MNILLLINLILYPFISIDSISEIRYGYCSKIEPDYYMVLHENYNDTVIILPDDINNHEKTYVFSDKLFLSWKELKNLKPSQEISDTLFSILFERDPINLWPYYDPGEEDSVIDSDMIIAEDADLPYENREDYLRKERLNFKIYLLGDIKIKENFSSKLILVFVKNEFYYMKNVFLLNVVNNQLKSMTKILVCQNYNGSSTYICTNTKLLNDSTFLRSEKIISLKDVEDCEVMDVYPKFYYDNEGYLIVLE